jgi:pectate lyase
MPHRRLLVGFLIAWAVATGPPAAAGTPATDRYLQAVRTFADRALTHGRDRYGAQHTPLFVDGLHVETYEPAVWILPEDFAEVWQMPQRWVLSNLASQQQFFRTLDALTTLTGEDRYRQAAVDCLRYAFEHLQYDDGLLFWGGHAAVDLETGRVVGESHKDWARDIPLPAFWDVGAVHELKHHYPHYELMWQVSPEATRRFIEGFWSAHILDWSRLDMNRHGLYDTKRKHTWDHSYIGGPVPFTGRGLSFIHTGSDMIYAAVLLSEKTDDRRPLVWARRLAERYLDASHPRTGLGPDVYAFYRNERLLQQFGPEFGERLTETSIASLYGGRYGHSAVCLLKLGARLGAEGEIFTRLALNDLTAFAHAYDPQDNHFWSMLTDGTRLTPEDVKRPGSLGPEAFRKRRAGGIHFWGYALAARLSGEPLYWDMAHRIGEALGLGRIGGPDAQPELEPSPSSANVYLLFGLLELHTATGDDKYLQAAAAIGDLLLEREFHHGFFLPGPGHLFAKLDTDTPLALLTLHARLRQLQVRLPEFWGGRSFFHSQFEGRGRTYDSETIYSRTRRTP